LNQLFFKLFVATFANATIMQTFKGIDRSNLGLFESNFLIVRGKPFKLKIEGYILSFDYKF